MDQSVSKVSIRMRNEGLCIESIRAIKRYFASLPFDQGVHAYQSGLQSKFSGLCTRTDQSHLAALSIDRNAIGCYNFVQIKSIFVVSHNFSQSRPVTILTQHISVSNFVYRQVCDTCRDKNHKTQTLPLQVRAVKNCKKKIDTER